MATKKKTTTTAIDIKPQLSFNALRSLADVEIDEGHRWHTIEQCTQLLMTTDAVEMQALGRDDEHLSSYGESGVNGYMISFHDEDKGGLHAYCDIIVRRGFGDTAKATYERAAAICSMLIISFKIDREQLSAQMGIEMSSKHFDLDLARSTIFPPWEELAGVKEHL